LFDNFYAVWRTWTSVICQSFCDIKFNFFNLAIFAETDFAFPVKVSGNISDVGVILEVLEWTFTATS
jgi:hypothetical protein